MPANVVQCRECAFDNPRGWIVCARCGLLLGPAGARGRAESDTDVITQPAAQPTRGPSSAGEDAKTELFSIPSYGGSDARPLLGQAALLQSARQMLASSFAQHRPRLFVIEGERGAGKTRLLTAVSELAAKNYNNVRVLYATCRAGDDSPYAPFSRILLDRFGITPASAPSKVRSQMAADVSTALGKRDAGRIAETTHILGHVAGVRFPNSPFLHGLRDRPDALIERIGHALRRFLAGDADERPLLLLLDDMGRAEREAWRILDAVLDTEAPLAVVIAGQPPLSGPCDDLAGHHPVERQAIQPLSKQELAQLTAVTVPSVGPIPPTLVDALMHRSQGNPGALHEILHAAIDRGLFQRTADGVEVDLQKLGSGDFPINVDDAIRGRVGALDADERELLERAAVVGERFWDGVLLAMARSEGPAPDPALPPLSVWNDVRDEMGMSATLQRLEQKQFIERVNQTERTGLLEYAFRHADARRVLYADLAEPLRSSRHAVTARWLSLMEGMLEGAAQQLGPQLEAAGQLTRAGLAYLRAAGDAQSDMRNRTALSMVEKARPLLDEEDVDARMEAAHQHGSLLMTLGRYDEAHAAFHDMLRMAWTLGARGRGGAALNRIARIHRQRGEHQAALDNFKGALLMFRAADDQRGVASTYDDLAQIHRWRGHTDGALSAAKEALEIRIAIKDKRGQAVSLNTIGYIQLDRGRFDDAEARFKTALKIRREIEDREGEVQTLIAIGRLALQRGEYRDAAHIFREALQGSRDMDNHRFQSYTLEALGEAYLQAGEHLQAYNALNEARELATAMRDQRLLADIQRMLGLLLLADGDPGAADSLETALELARQYGTRESIAMAHRCIGRLRAHTLYDQEGQGETAEASFREALQMFQECGAPHEVARTQVELGYYLLERGDIEVGRDLLRSAQGTLRRLKLPQADQIAGTLAEL